MAALPPPLVALFDAPDADGRDTAWAAFVAAHTALLLHVARSVTTNADAAMDAYAHLLAALRDDDFRRLRGYTAYPGSQFTTWLVVVARRICFDWHRQRYGRASSPASAHQTERAQRRRLENLVTGEGDAAVLARVAAPDVDADEHLRTRELHATLKRVVDALPAGDRVLLRLRCEDGLPAREVARLLGFPSPFHVYRRVNALLAALRRSLESRGIESAAP